MTGTWLGCGALPTPGTEESERHVKVRCAAVCTVTQARGTVSEGRDHDWDMAGLLYATDPWYRGIGATTKVRGASVCTAAAHCRGEVRTEKRVPL